MTHKKRGPRLIFTICLLAALLLLASGCSIDRSAAKPKDADALTQPETVQADLVIPVAEVSEEVGFYPVTVDGTQLEVLAVKASDGSLRTAFNTCQVCFGSGRGYYKQTEKGLQCQNCGNTFSTDQVEIEAGGCNPWPIFSENKTVSEDSITIGLSFLQESAKIFENWKKQ